MEYKDWKTNGEVYESEVCGYEAYVDAGDVQAECIVLGMSEPEVKKKTKLIVAAPELLEALKNMVNVAKGLKWKEATTGRQIILQDAEQAIKKATE